jgi:hypothetical protein
MSRLLENIIKNVINELAGKLDLKWRALTDKDRTFIKQDVISLLGVKSTEQDDFNKLGGLVLTATRRFGRMETPGSETKSYSYTPSEIKNDIRTMLNSLTSSFTPMKKAGYVWLVTTDLNPVLPDAKAKAEKIITRYEFLCVYVSQSALMKNIDPTTTGYLYSLDDGALIFDWNNINASQWKKTGKGSADPVTSIMHAPYTLAKFGEKTNVVKQLYIYFDLDLNKELGFITPDDSVFNCELKSVIEWYQKTNKIPVTGAWDELTRNASMAINTVPYPVPSDAVAEIRSAAQACKLETNPKPSEPISTETIIVPESGFKYGEKQNLEFYKVQKLMLAHFEKILSNTDTALKLKQLDIYKTYIKLKKALENPKNQGNYLGLTSTMVTFIKNGFNLALNNGVVDNEFVDKLKKELNK